MITKMDLLVWTSVLIVSSPLSSVASRTVHQATLSHQDLISHPGEHDTVKTWSEIPSSSSYPPPPLNPGKLLRPKSPSPEEADNVRLRAKQFGQVQLAFYPPLRPPTGHLQPNVSDPDDSSARPVPHKASSGMMILGLNSNKKLPQISRLAGLIRGIYWTLDSPNTHSSSLTDQRNQKALGDAEKWIKDVKTHRRVLHIQLEQGRFHCGNNYLLTFDDGSQACAKQRHNYDQIQGEIFAYFLADLLQMRHHLPPTVLVKAVNNRLFESVMQDIQQSPTWDPTKPFIITKYLSNLKPLLLPSILHPIFKAIVRTAQVGGANATGGNATEDNPNPLGVDEGPLALVTPPISPRSQQLGQLSREELRELVQWSDLVIFDYLLGNLDRMANSAVNLQWHQQMLSLPVHNIFQTADADGNFIFMDNESGLFHGYRLIDQYDRYLQPLLRSFCVFNKHTVNAIKKLHQSRTAGAQMMKMLSLDYPRLLNRLPGIGPKTSHVLQKRLRFVYNHIRFCEENYFLP